jgi:serine/threonine protein kinase
MTYGAGVPRAVPPIIMGHTAPLSGFSTPKCSKAGATVMQLAPAAGCAAYRPTLRLATGGMGSVYLGYREGAGSSAEFVAIKRVHAHLATEFGLHDLLRSEAAYMAAVRHPNVVGFVDFANVEGEPALVMEYVEGSSLAQLGVGQTALPVAIALRIALDACAGLAATHAANGADGAGLGLVHRDVSPQNVIVGVDGMARIADFGVAKGASEEQAGLYGKRGYMAPEYLTMGVATASADVFALGIVIWEMLTGTHLFRRSSELETIGRTLSADASSIGSASGAAAALDPVLAYALAPDPQYRASALELAVAIESAGLPIASHDEVGAFVEHAARAPVTRVAAVTNLPEAVEATASSFVMASRRPPPLSLSPLAVVRPRPVAQAEPQADQARRPTWVKYVALAVFAVVLATGTSAIAQLGFDDVATAAQK